MKKLFILLLISLTLLTNITLAQENTLKSYLHQKLSISNTWQIHLLDFYKLYQQQELILIDIRSPETYQKAHVKGSLNIHLPNLPQTILEQPNILPKDQPIYIICCAQDSNAYYAVLPLRIAGYEAYAVTGGGVDAWQYLQLPYLEQGTASELEFKYNTKLTDLEIQALVAINPDYHMLKVGRSYGLKLQPLEQIIAEGKDLFVIQIWSEQERALLVKAPYVKHTTTLKNLLTSSWLENIEKKQQLFIVGQDDKQLVLATIALRMLGYDAMFAIEE